MESSLFQNIDQDKRHDNVHLDTNCYVALYHCNDTSQWLENDEDFRFWNVYPILCILSSSHYNTTSFEDVLNHYLPTISLFFSR